MAHAKNTSQLFFIVAALAVLTLAAFWGVRNNDFINFDDPYYVSENPIVQRGLTREGIAWAFSADSVKELSNWHPLTWMSHMLDCEISGKADPLKISIHHSTSLFLHAANALLIFVLLNRMTSAIWRSACVAAIFALHPLRVESVAWIAERKDVLSTLMGLLAMFAYARYVEQCNGQISDRKTNRRKWYFLSLAFFALGLMCKPMLVTLPFILLLLDFWPLRRAPFGQRPSTPVQRLLIEKIPFFVLTLVACAVTIWAQKTGRSIQDLQSFPIDTRINNAFVSCVRYIGKLFWPGGLAVFYPHPKSWPAWQSMGSMALVACVTFAACKWARRWPFLFTGWFWFLGTLVPVIGIVQVGVQSMADRYTYLPMVGLSILLVWGFAEIFSAIPRQRWILAAVTAASLTVCFFLTRQQVNLWRNSETLYRHTLLVTKENFTAHENLGIVLGKEAVIDAAEGRTEIAQRKRAEATKHFLAGLAIYPDNASAHHNLGNALKAEEKFAEARGEYLKATEIDPGYWNAYMNLGYLAVMEGNFEMARGYYAKSVELKPDDFVAHLNLGSASLETGRSADAIRHFRKVLELSPNHLQALYQLGIAAMQQGENNKAIQYFNQVLQLNPNHQEASVQLHLARQK